MIVIILIKTITGGVTVVAQQVHHNWTRLNMVFAIWYSCCCEWNLSHLCFRVNLLCNVSHQGNTTKVRPWEFGSWSARTLPPSFCILGRSHPQGSLLKYMHHAHLTCSRNIQSITVFKVTTEPLATVSMSHQLCAMILEVWLCQAFTWLDC